MFLQKKFLNAMKKLFLEIFSDNYLRQWMRIGSWRDDKPDWLMQEGLTRYREQRWAIHRLERIALAQT